MHGKQPINTQHNTTQSTQHLQHNTINSTHFIFLTMPRTNKRQRHLSNLAGKKRQCILLSHFERRDEIVEETEEKGQEEEGQEEEGQEEEGQEGDLQEEEDNKEESTDWNNYIDIIEQYLIKNKNILTLLTLKRFFSLQAYFVFRRKWIQQN